MIRRVSILTRKPELSHEEFVDHWENVHGPLALKVPGIRRYVQSQSRASIFDRISRRRQTTSMASQNSGMTALKTLSDQAKHRKRRRFTPMVR